MDLLRVFAEQPRFQTIPLNLPGTWGMFLQYRAILFGILSRFARLASYGCFPYSNLSPPRFIEAVLDGRTINVIHER